MAKLSETMRRMLKNAYHYDDPWRSVRGQSQHGGAHGTLLALIRRGLLDHVDYKPTAAGVAELTCPLCSKVHDPEGPIKGCVLR